MGTMAQAIVPIIIFEEDNMADEIKNGENTENAEATQPTEAEAPAKQEQPIEDPVQILRQLCRGTLKLFTPIRAAGHDVTELNFDFVGLSTMEILDALDDTAVINTSAFAITNRQAMAIFAATAGKCTKDVDAIDIKQRISGVDAIKAIQLAKLFWNASHRAGNKNILNA